jgi:hypothetical protein
VRARGVGKRWPFAAASSSWVSVPLPRARALQFTRRSVHIVHQIYAVRRSRLRALTADATPHGAS